MKTLEDAEQRWTIFNDKYPKLDTLISATRTPGLEPPTSCTFRSICWKAFLLFEDVEEVTEWPQILTHSRAIYTGHQKQYLQYIKHPEKLDSTVDPLADEADSPWNALRQDEELRVEIRQDVERCMQDEEFFRLPSTQEMMVDALFIYCKINDNVSYRQGMHEVLAPLLWAVQYDAVKIDSSRNKQLEMLDAQYIEHDAYSMFSKIMETAKSSYEQGKQLHQSSSRLTSLLPAAVVEPAIVERSKYIHEDLLGQVDPDLATHLTAIEILPQIFLIRWIRLLFGREFQFSRVLDLWDVLFAEGLTNDLVDLVCVAMLLRIRWKLLDADYSTALALLLHYPEGSSDGNMASFVKDAIFLRNNLTTEGGSQIVNLRTHRSPAPQQVSSQPGLAQSIDQVSSMKTRLPRGQGPSAARISAGIDDLVQGAAKGVLSRGEKWGWNKVVRDAVGEVRKNVQGLQSGNSNWKRAEPRWSLDEGRLLGTEAKENQITVRHISHRNENLAQILASVTLDLREAVDGKKGNSLSDAATLAISKLNLVRICLEDSTIPIQFDPVAAEHDEKSPSGEPESPQKADKDSAVADEFVRETPTVEKALPVHTAHPVLEPRQKPAIELRRGSSPILDQPRSSIAKSSFAWMLGEDDTPASGFKTASFSATPSERRGSTNGSEGPSLLFGGSEEPSRGDRPRKKGAKGVEDLLMGDL